MLQHYSETCHCCVNAGVTLIYKCVFPPSSTAHPPPHRVSGLSPFMGDNDNETLSNVTSATWDFEDEAFDEISDNAKDFITNLLKKSMK